MRNLSKARKVFCLLACFTWARAEDGQSVAPARSLAETEINFARTAAEKGTRQAFLDFLAADSVMFDPGAVNGQKLWQVKAPSPSRLAWAPAFVAVSAAGDLGYSTGPWDWRKDPAATKAEAFGQFFTVWKKQRDGTWKVALDLGIDTPAPTSDPAENQLSLAEPTRANSNVETARRSLRRAQRIFADTSARDNGLAVPQAASDDVRAFRNGVFPGSGRDSVRVMLSSDHAKTTFERKGGEMSTSGDLAFDYGEFATERNDFVEKGNYVQVWKTAPDGTWKLAIDLRKANPRPAPKP